MGRDKDSSQGKGSRKQRFVARSTFGGMVAILLAVAGLPLGLSLAQVTPNIEIINPHSGTAIEISDKTLEYHLNTWVNSIPPSPLVEFELDVDQCVPPPGAGDTTTTRTIGVATQEGNSFSFKWDIEDDVADTAPRNPPDPPAPCLQPSFEYTLRAILYTGFTGPGTGVEVDRDEVAVEINHLGENAGENLEITYPENGGPLGVFIRQDGGGGNFTIEAETSTGTRYVTPFFTISEFGQDPVWRQCGSSRGYSGTSTQGGKTIAVLRCSTPAGIYALDITGVALVTNDTPSPDDELGADPANDDAGDAHMVTPYFQRVDSLTLTPETTNNNVRTECVQFVAKAMDQNARPIGNLNIDVMAQGPTDQLRFDGFQGNSGRISDAMQVPNKNHPGNGELAHSCSGGNRGTGTAGRQGEHNIPGGDDIKHIESVAGTDVGGEFEFALTTDANGETQVMAYADENDDDLFCDLEKSDNASIGWNVPAPGASGFGSETSECAVTTPSNSPTPTTSPSGSVSGSSSSSPDPEPEEHTRNITINFAHGSLIVSGRVTVDDGTNKCRNDVPVKIKRFKNGKFRTLKTVSTNSTGNYSGTVRDREGRYRAKATQLTLGDDVCVKTSATARHNH